MQIEILGAHCLESDTTRLTCILVDGVLAIDAGSLTRSLSFEQQRKIEAILLSHQHIDHSRDIAFIGYYNALQLRGGTSNTKRVYSISEALDNLSAHILNGKTFPDFTREFAPGKPALQFCPLESYKAQNILGYEVKAIPVKHAVTTVGYSVTSQEGKSLFFTADTGPDIPDCWEHISPDILIADVTSVNRYSKIMSEVGHLTPEFLKQLLIRFREAKGYIPNVIVIHIPPDLEDELRQEASQVASELDADITLGYEGMKISL